MRVLPFLFISLIILNNCTTTEPENKFTFTPEDASCTEVWLNIEATGSVTVERDGAEPKQLQVNGSYTFYEEGLKPNTEYNYTATTGDKKLTAKITTLDTTSHNFTWESFTFGDYTSVLYDIVIINGNDIWAVGDIVKEDSLGNSEHFNAVHWNGNSWELKKITVEFRGSHIVPILEGIFAFSPNDIWFAGSLPVHWDGQNYTMFDIRTTVDSYLSVSKVWGSNTNNMFFVGLGGSIAHYNGAGWTKIESGTTTELLDVYGEGDNVYMGGYESFKPTVLLNYNRGQITKILEFQSGNEPNGLRSSFKTLWEKNNKIYLSTGCGLSKITSLNPPVIKSLYNGSCDDWGAYNRIRGNNVNDIFAVGIWGNIQHYNGQSLLKYTELVNADDTFLSLDYKGDIMAATGYRYIDGVERYGLITIGKRR